MSASLVGSEMCIRDRRSEVLQLSRTQRSGHPSSRTELLAPREREPMNYTCLLYTSDAADDM
eukprot:12663659-Alexandrium_andersonii.AAC.1